MSMDMAHQDNSNRHAEKHLRIAYTSVDILNSCSMIDACRNLEWLDVDVSVTYADSNKLDNDEGAFLEFLDVVRDSDVLIVSTHDDPDRFSKFGRLLLVADNNRIPLFMNSGYDEVNRGYAHLSGLSEDKAEELRRYMRLGGEKNSLNAILWMCRNMAGCDIRVPDPIVPVCQGIYRPGSKGLLREDGFLDSLDPTKPTVAVLFHQRMWMENNLFAIDALVQSIEAKGGQALPVFFMSVPDKGIGSIGTAGVIKRYLMRGRRSLVDSVILVGGFSHNALNIGGGSDGFISNIFAKLNVPIIQAGIVNATVDEWKNRDSVLDAASLASTIVQPEMDGQIISVPFCFVGSDLQGNFRYDCIPDRVDKIASMGLNWARLKRKPIGALKVALILNSGGQSEGRLGLASGFDAFSSLRRLLMRLSKEGFKIDWIPKREGELLDRLLKSAGTVYGPYGQSSPSPGGLSVSGGLYAKWAMDLPHAKCREMEREWGDLPGGILTEDGGIPIPGVIDGNVFIGVQPRTYAELDYRVSVPSHQYYAFYRWVREVFGADVVVHMGSRGTLESMPGKTVNLSAECWPDILIGALPNLYLFAVDDAGGGMVAKRRTNSVLVGYVDAPTLRSGAYGDLEELDSLIQQHMLFSSSSLQEKLDIIEPRIIGLVRRMGILHDLCLPEEITDRGIIAYLDVFYRYIQEIKGYSSSYGLHILGDVPKGKGLLEYIEELVATDERRRASLVKALEAVRTSQEGGGDALSAFIGDMAERGFVAEDCFPLCGGDKSLESVVSFVCDEVRPKLVGIRNEMDAVIGGLRGGFIMPGLPGSLKEGNLQILPTGRNFCSMDPTLVPTQLSYGTGSAVAEQVVKRYVDINGKYPSTISISMGVSNLINTGGDEVSYALRLMGVRPVWRHGHVSRLEVIPLEELGRPRVDVVFRTSSMFLNTFPNLVLLLQEALDLVSGLDEEEEESNAIRRHLSEDMTKYIREGVDSVGARARSRMRMFLEEEGSGPEGAAPMAEGDGLTPSIQFRWWSGRIDVTAVSSFDLFGGNMESLMRSIAMEKGLNKDAQVMLVGEEVRTLSTEMSLVMRGRILNPKWISRMMDHGFVGAGELSRIIHGLFEWATHTDVVKDWMFQGVTERYVLSDTVRQWMLANNPFAMRDIVSDMYKAVEDGVWHAPAKTLMALRDAYLDAEGAIEEGPSFRLV